MLPLPLSPAARLAVALGILIPVILERLPAVTGWPYHDLLWSLLVVPAAVIAYHGGLRGGWIGGALMASVAFASDMLERGPDARLVVSHRVVGTAMAYNTLAVSVGIGWVAERLHRQGRKIAALNRELADLARKDSLTGLWNRRTLETELHAELRRAAEWGTSLAVVMLDLDGFKAVNDRLGHLAGDRLLQDVAKALRQTVRAQDMVCRYGGDEFAVILPGTSALQAARVAERICTALADLSPPGAPCRVGASCGVASFPEHAATQEALLRVADAALYEAKAQGGGVRLAPPPSAPPG